MEDENSCIESNFERCDRYFCMNDLWSSNSKKKLIGYMDPSVTVIRERRSPYIARTVYQYKAAPHLERYKKTLYRLYIIVEDIIMTDWPTYANTGARPIDHFIEIWVLVHLHPSWEI
jgi:hypothetical protein